MQQTSSPAPSKRRILDLYLKGHFKRNRSDAIQYFNKLDDAIEANQSKDITLSEEIHANGSRRFGNGSSEAVFEKISGNENQPLYEIIRPNVPIKFYLDIEGPLEVTETVISNTVDSVIDVLNKICKENKWDPISIDNVVVMTASTPNKLSIHLIFKTLVLRNIAHAGALTRTIQQFIVEEEMPYFVGLKPF
jgi:hypothetical protein